MTNTAYTGCNSQITNLHGSRVLDIMFVDVGVQASVEVFELREIPTTFLRDLVSIPPQVSITKLPCTMLRHVATNNQCARCPFQAVKCCLADLTVSVGSWTPDAVQWLRDKVLNTTDSSMKVTRLP